jgi:HNH endonuclease
MVSESNKLSVIPWRHQAASALRVFDTLFEKSLPDIRRQWESFLAESIEYVNRYYPERWGVSLFRRSLVGVRFNVGMVENIVLAKSGGAVLVDVSAVPSGAKMSGDYPAAKGCRMAKFSFEGPIIQITALRRTHQIAMDKSALRPSSGLIQRAHSPGVLRYLEELLGRKLSNPSYIEPDMAIAREGQDVADDEVEEFLQQRTDIGPTEKAQLINARRGQGVYRINLEQIEKRCRVTGIADQRYLRASHIKPWCKSTDLEKLDGYNGLLLSPHVDLLFDRGLISFSDDGKLLMSSALNQMVLSAWGISTDLNVGEFRPEQCTYLAWHRQAFGFGA